MEEAGAVVQSEMLEQESLRDVNTPHNLSILNLADVSKRKESIAFQKMEQEL